MRSTQVPKKHFPVVGLIGLILVAASMGSIYYYQFILPHNASCAPPVHRIFFISAVIQEVFGFRITGAAILSANNTVPLPEAHNVTAPPLNFTGIKMTNYTITDPKAIITNAGDTVTIYMYAINSTNPAQFPAVPPAQGLGHGFDIDGFGLANKIRLDKFSTWASTTFTVSLTGSFTYRCIHSCSPEHGQMTGSLSVNGCG